MAVNLKHIKTQGGTIEVILRDDLFTPFFKRTVEIQDKKAIRQLLHDIENKGVPIKIGWFD